MSKFQEEMVEVHSSKKTHPHYPKTQTHFDYKKFSNNQMVPPLPNSRFFLKLLKDTNYFFTNRKQIVQIKIFSLKLKKGLSTFFIDLFGEAHLNQALLPETGQNKSNSLICLKQTTR